MIQISEPALHVRQAEGLRQLADFIERHPELAKTVEYEFRHMTSPVSSHTDARSQLVAVLDAARRDGVPFRAADDDDRCHIDLSFGNAVTLVVYATAARMAGEAERLPSYVPVFESAVDGGE